MTAEERREQRLEALWTLNKISGIPVERLEPAYDAGFKAGRSSGLEEAAQVAEGKRVEGYITYNNACNRIAAAIHALITAPQKG